MKNGITINALAGQFGLARSTLLYYDRAGLLNPSARSGGNYRLYSQCDVERLRQICLYRKMGIPLKEIARMLLRNRTANESSREILQRRLESLEGEIESLQTQQRQIVRLLEELSKKKKSAGVGGKKIPAARARATGKNVLRNMKNVGMENQMINKKRWTEIMDAAGFTDEDKKKWHKQFEKMEPQGHQEFLESLGIDGDEIARIRKSARG